MPVVKDLIVGQKKLETPNLFVSYRMGDFPHAGLKFLPWKKIDVDALLINAYDFFNPRYQQMLDKNKKIGDILEFDKIIMMDSGGYYFIEKHKININPLEVLKIECMAKVDIGVVLDHPLHPSAVNPLDRIKNTIKNTEIMFKALHQDGNDNDLTLIPVIHGYDLSSLSYTINSVKNIMKKYNGGSLDYVGIGGLVPLSQKRDNRLVQIIAYVRRILPNSYIHCFSLGSPLMMLIAFFYGADSVDTQGWIKSAAYRAVNLPGLPSVKIRRREKEENPKEFERKFMKLEKHLEYLESNEGFKPIYPLEELIDTPKENRLHNRALHNLYVYVYEAKEARKAISKGYFDDFIRERLSKSKLKKFIDFQNQKR